MTDYLELESNTDNLLLESGIGDKLILESFGLVATIKKWWDRNACAINIIMTEEEEWH